VTPARLSRRFDALIPVLMGYVLSLAPHPSLGGAICDAHVLWCCSAICTAVSWPI